MSRHGHTPGRQRVLKKGVEIAASVAEAPLGDCPAGAGSGEVIGTKRPPVIDRRYRSRIMSRNFKVYHPHWQSCRATDSVAPRRRVNGQIMVRDARDGDAAKRGI